MNCFWRELCGNDESYIAFVDFYKLLVPLFLSWPTVYLFLYHPSILETWRKLALVNPGPGWSVSMSEEQWVSGTSWPVSVRSSQLSCGYLMAQWWVPSSQLTNSHSERDFIPLHAARCLSDMWVYLERSLFFLLCPSPGLRKPQEEHRPPLRTCGVELRKCPVSGFPLAVSAFSSTTLKSLVLAFHCL